MSALIIRLLSGLTSRA